MEGELVVVEPCGFLVVVEDDPEERALFVCTIFTTGRFMTFGNRCESVTYLCDGAYRGARGIGHHAVAVLCSIQGGGAGAPARGGIPRGHPVGAEPAAAAADSEFEVDLLRYS